MLDLTRGGLVAHLRAAIAMARPYFLLGTVPLYLLGALVAAREPRRVALIPFGLGLAIVLSTQLLTHYYNEYHDVETDRNAADSALTGGSGTLSDHEVAPAFARWLGRGTALGTALLVGLLVVAVEAGPLPVGVAVLAMAVGWAYSSPPFRLVARGLGEAAVVVLAGILVPVFGALLQGGPPGPDLGPVLATLVLLTFGMNVSTTLPDIEGDRRTGKRTLAVRLGHRRVADLGLVAFLSGSLLGTWTVDQIRPGAWALGAVVTGLVVLVGWRPFVRARAGDQRAASRLAVIVTAAYGTIVVGLSLVIGMA